MEHARRQVRPGLNPTRVVRRVPTSSSDTPSGISKPTSAVTVRRAATFTVEMRPETWSLLGFDKTEDEVFPASSATPTPSGRAEEIFAPHLEAGSGLLGNNSRWLQFPTIGCSRWYHGNMVLMGDAVYAHFSVGSGTKLAMEDAIALAGRLSVDQPLEEAFGRYEEERRPEVASLQRAAKASRDWFEGADRYRNMDPEQFVFSMLTRSQRITYDNLRVRDPGYMSGIDAWYAGSEHACPPVGPDSHRCSTPSVPRSRAAQPDHGLSHGPVQRCRGSTQRMASGPSGKPGSWWRRNGQ